MLCKLFVASLGVTNALAASISARNNGGSGSGQSSGKGSSNNGNDYVQGRSISNLIVMGDSYSDSCNSYNGGYFNEGFQPPENATTFPNCPPPPIGRADEGRSWPEWIRIDQDQVETEDGPPGGSPFTPGQWDIVNLAQSGATCDNAIFPRAPIPDVGEQTTLYQNNYNTSTVQPRIQSDADGLALAMFIGTNDVTLALNGTGTVSQETDCIEQRLTKLHTIGFRYFLMIENINLQDCPQLNTTRYRDGAERLVNANNREQKQLFSKLLGYWRDETVIDVFPAYDLFKSFHDNPDEYGFTNVNEGCDGCDNPGEYLWANALHPSSRAFHIFARKVQRYITNGARGQALIAGAEGL